MQVLKLILFLVFLVVVLGGMAVIFRMLFRAWRTFYGHGSDDLAERIFDAADEIGIDTGGVRKLMEALIGESIEDPGSIEARKYGRLDIEYSAKLHQVEGEKQIVLFIRDEALKPSLLDIEKRTDEYRIPIRGGAAYTLQSILDRDEERFMRNAEDYESLLTTNQMIEKDPIVQAKNDLLRWIAFLPLKNFGRVDRIIKQVPLSATRKLQTVIDISAYIGKEHDETLLVLRFDAKYKDTAAPGGIHHILYYPFGARGRENLRKILSKLR